MIAAITTKISANATTIRKQLFSDRTPIEITMMVEIDFHSISSLVSTYMKAVAGGRWPVAGGRWPVAGGGGRWILTHVPPLRMSACEAT